MIEAVAFFWGGGRGGIPIPGVRGKTNSLLSQHVSCSGPLFFLPYPSHLAYGEGGLLQVQTNLFNQGRQVEFLSFRGVALKEIQPLPPPPMPNSIRRCQARVTAAYRAPIPSAITSFFISDVKFGYLSFLRTSSPPLRGGVWKIPCVWKMGETSTHRSPYVKMPFSYGSHGHSTRSCIVS